VHIEWPLDSNQPTTIIPIQYLINNYPSFDARDYAHETNFTTSSELKFFDYTSLLDKNGAKNKQGVYEWLRQMAAYGVCVVRNVPTEEKMVKRLAEIIAPVQNTIYGEIFDVKVDENPINIAYSNAKLGFHMDLMYYESPPGLQFLHCLK
jgi:gamma-butyrobetaine dioxygenase